MIENHGGQRLFFCASIIVTLMLAPEGVPTERTESPSSWRLPSSLSTLGHDRGLLCVAASEPASDTPETDYERSKTSSRAPWSLLRDWRARSRLLSSRWRVLTLPSRTGEAPTRRLYHLRLGGEDDDVPDAAASA